MGLLETAYDERSSFLNRFFLEKEHIPKLAEGHLTAVELLAHEVLPAPRKAIGAPSCWGR